MKITRQAVIDSLDIRQYLETVFSGNGGLGKVRGDEAKVRCIFHDDKNPSLTVNIKSGAFLCHSCGAKGGVFDIYMKQHGVDFGTAKKALAEIAGLDINAKPTSKSNKSGTVKTTPKDKPLGKIVKIYDYIDLDGRLRHQTVKFDPKSFRQRQPKPGKDFSKRRPNPNVSSDWKWNLNGVEVILYRLQDLTQSSGLVFMPEGEKDVDNLYKLGLTATCNPMGAGKWWDGLNPYLRDRDIVILPDNDNSGKKHEAVLTKELFDIAASIKVLHLPGLPEKGDVSDWIAAGGTKEQLLQMVTHDCGEWTPDGIMPVGYSAATLATLTFPPVRWAVPQILPEGVTILGGKPKQGKSIFSLDIGIAIACGGKALGAIDVEQGAVIYLALEDTKRRLQGRLQMTPVGQGCRLPEQLILFPDWPRMGIGGIRLLERKVKSTPNLRLIIIDTFAVFKPLEKVTSNSAYDVDYGQVRDIKRLADTYSIAILLVHHLRKSESEDPMDNFLGSMGLTGAADGLIALVKKTGTVDAELHVTGRDVEAAEFAMSFQPDLMSWRLLGNAGEVKATKQQQTLYDALKAFNTYDNPTTPSDLADITGLSSKYIKKTLPKLMAAGDVEKIARGQYVFIRDSTGQRSPKTGKVPTCQKSGDFCIDSNNSNLNTQSPQVPTIPLGGSDEVQI